MNVNVSKAGGKETRALPTARDVVDYLQRSGGEATTESLYLAGFGDVGRGWQTVGLLKTMIDSGILARAIDHERREHRGGPFPIPIAKTKITWKLRDSARLPDFEKKYGEKFKGHPYRAFARTGTEAQNKSEG